MRRQEISLVLTIFLGMAASVRLCSSAELTENLPNRDTPPKVVEAWLHFHEMDLCLAVDAVFIFNRNGMEVWYEFEDEKHNQRLQELFRLPHDGYQIELYSTYHPVERNTDDPIQAPASLWENYALRAYLGDLSARSRDQRINLRLDFEAPPDDDIKQRLSIFADQMLEWSRRLKRYATDLPLLARLAFDPGTTPEIGLQASMACSAHVQNMGKYLAKLAANLTEALPRSDKKAQSIKPEKPGKPGKSPMEDAVRISNALLKISERIHQFIFPKHFTVGVGDLRQPDLLITMRAAEKMISDFQNELPGRPADKESGAGKNWRLGTR